MAILEVYWQLLTYMVGKAPMVKIQMFKQFEETTAEQSPILPGQLLFNTAGLTFKGAPISRQLTQKVIKPILGAELCYK